MSAAIDRLDWAGVRTSLDEVGVANAASQSILCATNGTKSSEEVRRRDAVQFSGRNDAIRDTQNRLRSSSEHPNGHVIGLIQAP